MTKRGTGRARRARGLLAILGAAAACGLAAVGCGGSSPTEPNRPPNLRDVVVQPAAVVLGGVTRATALASDPDGNPVTYAWRAAAGSLSGTTTASVNWTAPQVAGGYSLVVTVSDGELSVTDSVTVLVGEGSLTVLSDPPGAGVSIDGDLIAYETPHTYERVAIGNHRLGVQSAEYTYSPSLIDAFVAHGDADTVRFTLPATRFEILNTGRTDIERIGTLAYLPTGTGLLFTAITTADGPGIYTSTFSPRTGEPNGIFLTGEVKIDESIAVSADGAWLIHTGSTGVLIASRLYDAGGDGLVDSLGTGAIPLRSGSYGPTLSTDGRLAFALGPVESEDVIPLLWAEFADGALSLTNLVTTSGRRASWRPNGRAIVYERDGGIFARDFDGTNPGSEYGILDAAGEAGGLPAWGPRAAGHVAYAWGDGADFTEIRIQIPKSTDAVPVFTGLFDPTGIAWSPLQRVLAVAHNPGRGQIVLVLDLPVP